MRRISGFTLLELLITLFVLMVLGSMALPGLSAVIEQNRLTNMTNTLLGALRYARAEAVSLRGRVTLCKSGSGSGCADTGGYEQGWIVFRDEGLVGQLEASDQVLRVFQGAENLTINGNAPVRNYVSFVASGASRSASGAFQAGSITLCMRKRSGRLILSGTGRVRSEPQGTACSG